MDRQVHQRRQWHPTPVFLPGESQGWRSLVGCRLWGPQSRTQLKRLSSSSSSSSRQVHGVAKSQTPLRDWTELNFIPLVYSLSLLQYLILITSVSSKITKCESSDFFFWNIILAILEPLHIPINFMTSLSIWDFERDCFESADQFENCFHHNNLKTSDSWTWCV